MHHRSETERGFFLPCSDEVLEGDEVLPIITEVIDVVEFWFTPENGIDDSIPDAAEVILPDLLNRVARKGGFNFSLGTEFKLMLVPVLPSHGILNGTVKIKK